MLQRMFAALAFTLAVAFGMPSLAQAKTDAPAPKEPTIQQIYEAANGGRMSDADAMIAKVLKDHPSSAKAHFVHSELLAAEGKLDDARSELAKAKTLSPELDFAKPEAVERLTNKLDKPAPQTRSAPSRVSEPAAHRPFGAAGRRVSRLPAPCRAARDTGRSVVRPGPRNARHAGRSGWLRKLWPRRQLDTRATARSQPRHGPRIGACHGCGGGRRRDGRAGSGAPLDARQ